jgi:hypothetical protein
MRSNVQQRGRARCVRHNRRDARRDHGLKTGDQAAAGQRIHRAATVPTEKANIVVSMPAMVGVETDPHNLAIPVLDFEDSDTRKGWRRWPCDST